jgi:FAD/FMN-containing dehydrogenase
MARDISRQAFLRGTLGTIASGALVSGCNTPSSSAPTPQSTGPRDWDALGKSIDGRVTLPSSPEYGTAKGLFNTRFADSAPVAVVTVKSTDDVSQTVRFAEAKGLRVAVRSGGHSYTGASAADNAVIVDLREMPGDITFDQDRVTIPGAAHLDSIQEVLAARGRSVPGGSCPTVGIAGLTLGGGLGSDSRRCGLTCDALASATVVLPSGETVTASARDHTDLFWALRGGGANLGVVTAMTFRTFPTADRDVVTMVVPDGTAAQAIAGWRQWMRGADRAVWGMVNLTAKAGSQRCTVVLATPAGEGRGTAGDLVTAIGVQPASITVRTLGHLEFVRYFEGGSQASQPRSFLAGSDIIGDTTTSAADAIVAAMSSWPDDAGSATAVMESLSGAVADVSAADTAFPWRGEFACVQWYTEPSAETVSTATRWLGEAHAAVRAHSVGGYVNYAEADMPVSRYFGGNFERLVAVRRRYDPAGLMYAGL